MGNGQAKKTSYKIFRIGVEVLELTLAIGYIFIVLWTIVNVPAGQRYMAKVVMTIMLYILTTENICRFKLYDLPQYHWEKGMHEPGHMYSTTPATIAIILGVIALILLVWAIIGDRPATLGLMLGGLACGPTIGKRFVR